VAPRECDDEDDKVMGGHEIAYQPK